MTSKNDVVAQARDLRIAARLDLGSDESSTLANIAAILLSMSLSLIHTGSASESNNDCDAYLERGSTIIAVRDTLSTAETNVAVAHVIAAKSAFPGDDRWAYKRDSHYHNTNTENILRVETSTPESRRASQVHALACELLLPGNVAADQFYVEGKSASEIATQHLLPIRIVLEQLEEFALDTYPDQNGINSSGDWSLSALDSSQQAAATAIPGPILVGAGPGTGKTRTLVARIVHLVRDLKINASSVLALTYSRVAAAQLKEQIETALGSISGKRHNPWVGTLHSFGMEIVRKYYSQIGFSHAPELLDTLDCVDLLEANLEKCNLDILLNLYDPASRLVDIIGRISRAQDELCTPDRYLKLSHKTLQIAVLNKAEVDARIASNEKVKKAENDDALDSIEKAKKCIEVAQCYAAYEAIKREQCVVDYGDLIMLPVYLLDSRPDIAAEIGLTYTHILADEYQDVNRASAKMLQLLSSPTNGAGLWVVGDHRQSIYRFRGASPVNIHKFQQDYPNGRRFELETNYRSVSQIVDCFSEFADISGLSNLPVEDANLGSAAWTAFRGDSEKDAIEVYEADSPESQNIQLATIVHEELGKGVEPAEIAVLCRTNTQAETVSAALESSNISTVTVGDPFVRPEIQNVIAFAAFAGGELIPSLHRIAQIDGFEDYAQILANIKSQMQPVTPLGEVKDTSENELDNVPLGQTSSDITTVLQQIEHPVARHLETAFERLKSHAETAHELLSFIVFDTLAHNTRDLCGNQTESVQCRLALQYLLSIAQCFDQKSLHNSQTHSPAASNFISYLKRMISLGLAPRIAARDSGSQHVRVMTVHAAKGLEFPVAILPYLSKSGFHTRGQSDGLIDPDGMLEDVDDSDEDRFLFFVGLSRAKNKLILMRPTGKSDKTLPISPLLDTLTPWFALQQIETQMCVTAVSDNCADTPLESANTPKVTGRKPVFTESALACYMRCPRQYYFQYIEKLSTSAPKSPYQKLHAVVWETLGFMHDSWASGETADVSDMLSQLESLWSENGPVGMKNEAVYFERAKRMVTNAFNFGINEMEVVREVRLEADLEDARVKLHPDAILHSSDGASLTVVKYKAGRRIDKDRLHESLSLMLDATEKFGRVPNVELRYLATGERVSVAKTKYDYDRINRYVNAVKGIQDQHFDADPGQQCGQCPFVLICDRN